MLNFITEENTALILFFIGIYGLIARRNVIKSIISMSIIQAAIILFFLSIKVGEVAPIGQSHLVQSDPLPQALMITAVVIGMSVTGISLIMFITSYNIFGSTNWNRIKRAKEGHDG